MVQNKFQKLNMKRKKKERITLEEEIEQQFEGLAKAAGYLRALSA